jgi:hypothetical protein
MKARILKSILRDFVSPFPALEKAPLPMKASLRSKWETAALRPLADALSRIRRALGDHPADFYATAGYSPTKSVLHNVSGAEEAPIVFGVIFVGIP